MDMQLITIIASALFVSALTFFLTGIFSKPNKSNVRLGMRERIMLAVLVAVLVVALCLWNLYGEF